MKNGVHLFGSMARTAFCLVAAVTFTGNLIAGPGKIVGKVADRETGEALIGANILISHRVLPRGVDVPFDRPLGGSSDAEGYFLILNVPPGTYSLKASMIGYTPVIQQGARVESDRTIEVNFQLGSTVLELETVVVTAERRAIKPDVSSTQEVIGTSRLEQMPSPGLMNSSTS